MCLFFSSRKRDTSCALVTGVRRVLFRSVGIDAGAELVNAELGGSQGRPVEIVHCSVGVDQASNQECAQKFANDDDINLVINGYVFGSGFIFPILDAAGLPVLLQTPLTSPDFQATNGYAYAGGHAGGTVRTEERRAGKECVSTSRSWWSPNH